MCGTEPFPKDFRARKYRVERHFLDKVDCLYLYFLAKVCLSSYLSSSGFIWKNLAIVASTKRWVIILIRKWQCICC